MILSLVVALAAIPAQLHVEGNRLVEGGRTVVLRGVNIPSFEWSNEGEFVFRSARIAFEDWHANCIRLPLSQDRWFGKADKQTDHGEAYRQSVEEVVNLALNRDKYIILDLHWSDANEWGKNLGQHDMPDDHSVQFWKDLAFHYRKDSHVLYGLYNEPHDVSWSIWRDGGSVTEKEHAYIAVGMQTLVNTVRSAKAKNVCVVGGLDWAYDLSGPVGDFKLSDPSGYGIAYDAHIYPWKNDWEGKVGIAALSVPVLIGEAGCLPTDKPTPDLFAPRLFDFIESHSLSWTAWCMHPTATPNLISDWLYKPTPFWGMFVKAQLKAAYDKGEK